MRASIIILLIRRKNASRDYQLSRVDGRFYLQIKDTGFEKVHLIDANLDETNFSHFHASRDISSNEFELCRFAFLLLVRK
jgi:hypothetical protein